MTGGLEDLIAYLDASPSQFHVVSSTVSRLIDAGWTQLRETDSWEPAERGFVVRDGAVIAWHTAVDAGPSTPFRVVGAHTDSPGLRIKPHPDLEVLGWRQLGVEVYGGILNNSWLDRDLGVAGRLVLRNGEVVDVAVREAFARVPQLAVHLDRDVNDKGLVLDKQQHLTPIWGSTSSVGDFATWITQKAGVDRKELAAWELQLFDTLPAAVIGADRSLLAAGRLDNQLSCWAATSALATSRRPATHTAVIALFDHEEVGSQSTAGASGPLLSTVLERLSILHGNGASGAHGLRENWHRAIAASHCISADNAHAVHPNYPERHEPSHRPMVGRGPAIKINANQRYATSATTAALFQRSAESAGAPWQTFVSRNNMPCGSTIGPLTATQLGISTVDVGVPQLSMHSARELCGVDDPLFLQRALSAFFSNT